MVMPAILGTLARSRGGGWTPAQATTDGGVSPEHWYDAGAGTYQSAGGAAAENDGDVVGQWQDQATAAVHVAQGTADNKPLLKLNILNGQPVLRFDGANDVLSSAFTVGGVLSQPFTIFAVAKIDDAEDNAFNVLTDGDDTTNRCFSGKKNNNNWMIHSGVDIEGSAADTSWNIWCMLFHGASSQFWHDGSSEASGDAGADAPDGFSVGAQTNQLYAWDGDIAEIIIYDSNLSDADKNEIGQYLAEKYGLSWSDIS